MLRVIGDVHGHVQPYMKLIKSAEYSVQLGDFGFAEQYRRLDWHLDQKPYDRSRHMIIPGNHDDYDNLPESALGNYGYRIVDQIGFFWVRGAFSVDHHIRTEGVSWWRQEELTFLEMQSMIDVFTQVTPTLILSHDCPQSIIPYITQGSSFSKSQSSATNKGLQFCLDIHRPRLWIFGHHHVTRAFYDGYTVFACLKELDYIDINSQYPFGYEEGIEAIRQKCGIEELR